MKSITIILGKLLMIIILLTSCSDIEYKVDPYEAMSKGCEIHDFYIPDLELQGKIIKDGYIAISTVKTYDINPLKNQVPSFKISAASTVHPDPSASQNFLDTVEYVVTSESGLSKTWKVFHKYRDFTKRGIGEVDSLWFKSHDELKIPSLSNENTIAVLGDYFVLSRNGLMFNRFTGEPTEESINKQGIDFGTGTEANTPFLVANDEAGNFIGALLGNWTAPYFRVYQWDKLDQAPKLILDYEASSEPIGGVNGTDEVVSMYGRKLVARGDITKEGVIGSYNIVTCQKNAYHDFWGMTGSKFNGKTSRISTGYAGKSTTNYYQLAYPTQIDKLTPYYFSDYNFRPGLTTNSPQTTLRYVWEDEDGKREAVIQGPLAGNTEDLGNGWGIRIYHSLPFKFYNKSYIAVLHSTSKKYYVTVIEVGDNPQDPEGYEVVLHSEHKIAFPEGITDVVGLNGNGTGGIAISPEVVGADEASRMNLYVFMTSTGVISYEFNNFVPEEEE